MRIPFFFSFFFCWSLTFHLRTGELFVINLIKIYIQYPRNHLMLSKTEREYLQGNLKLSKNYEYKITHSIRNKIKTFYQLELPLLQNSDCAEESRCEASRTGWLGKLTSCQSGLTPLNSGFEINII